MRRSSLWPWVLAAVAVVLAVSAFVLDALAGSHGDGWWLNVLVASAFAATAGVGLLVAVRRPGHPIGWLLQATAILLAAAGAAAGYADYSILEQPGALPGAEWAVLWDESTWPLLFATLIAIVLVFPDGRLPSPRWRRAMIGAAASFALLVILGLFDSEPFEAPYEKVDRPLPGLPGAFELLWPVAFLGVLASLVAGVQAVRVRFRRARGIERLQLKWLTFTAALVPATLLICLAGSLLGGNADGDAFNALFFFMLGAIPTSIGVAVLRYRLYDIDRVINRTLVYGVLTVLLATAYGATALLLGTALGSGSAWATAGATLLVAVAFRPLREAVQDAVDRRFSRARYDARRRIVGFLEDLRAGRAAPEAIEPLLREVLSDPRLELRFFLPETELYVDARGYPVDDQPEDRRLRTPVTRAGAPLGMVLHSAFDEEDRPGLLTEVLEVAGLAIEIARLRVALRRQLDEVEASRARIVAAGYEERRRLERDLHDGAQQRLISIGLALRHAQHSSVSRRTGRARRSRPRFRRSPSHPRSFGSLREGCGRPSSTRGWLPRSRSSPPARRSRSRSGPAGSATHSDRGGGVLHRQRGPDQRREAFGGAARDVEREPQEWVPGDLRLGRWRRRRLSSRGWLGAAGPV